MLEIRINGEPRQLAVGTTVQALLAQLKLDPRYLAVERNLSIVPRAEHVRCVLENGDQIEIVTLVGGDEFPWPPPFKLMFPGPWESSIRIQARRRHGQIRHARPDARLPGSERRRGDYGGRPPRAPDRQRGAQHPRFYRSFAIHDSPKYGRMFHGRRRRARGPHGEEILLGLGNPGANWVKLEVLGDKKTLLPDPIGTLEATERLVADGFEVLCYSTDDPMTARRLKQAGATSVMPAGSPIGSGQGILNPNNIRICLEYLKDGDPDYPVIVDAGVGTASDVSYAMELGCDGVLLNTGIAGARDPLMMAHAMRDALRSGRLAYLAGRIPRKLYATASSPETGIVAPRSAR